MIKFNDSKVSKEIRKDKEMKRKILMVFVALFLSMGYFALASAQAREGTEGTGAPVITQSFASKEVRPGDTWKVYLNVSDPKGDLKRIFAVIFQPGVGEYPVSMIRVKGKNSKELSGYIYLYTSAPGFSGEFVKLTLTVQVEDKSGKISQPAVFPLFMHSRAAQEAAPQGVFKEETIGPVMIQLRNVPGGASSSGDFAH
jgi:hypothetical protein